MLPAATPPSTLRRENSDIPASFWFDVESRLVDLPALMRESSCRFGKIGESVGKNSKNPRATMDRRMYL
jgi:hypothetical protein